MNVRFDRDTSLGPVRTQAPQAAPASALEASAPEGRPISTSERLAPALNVAVPPASRASSQADIALPTDLLSSPLRYPVAQSFYLPSPEMPMRQRPQAAGLRANAAAQTSSGSRFELRMMGFSPAEIEALFFRRGGKGFNRLCRRLSENTHRLRSEMGHSELYATLSRAATNASIAMMDHYQPLRQLGLDTRGIALVTRCSHGAQRISALCEVGPELIAQGVVPSHLVSVARLTHFDAAFGELRSTMAQYKADHEGLWVDAEGAAPEFGQHPHAVVERLLNAFKDPDYWDADV